jgi:protein-L-isoaspartate(D-aspartate) O-methyltransferase
MRIKIRVKKTPSCEPGERSVNYRKIENKMIGVILFALLNPFLFFLGACSTNPQNGQNKAASINPAEFIRLREKMVREQLQGRDIKDSQVLASMAKVPRHEFVPPDLIGAAYDDSALPLRMGQTISQPYIVGYMTQALELHGTERVLEIGTGSGYQAAVLAEIVREVYTVEILPELGEQAAATLKRLGYKNVRFRIGDGYAGWPEYAPYDRIIVTAAPENAPQPLIDQLKVGGRMIIPIGKVEQDLTVLIKESSGVARRSTIPVRFVPMTGQALEK